MYNNSKRFPIVVPQTGFILGPSYYTVDTPPDYKECYAPFFINSYRTPTLNPLYTDTIYDISQEHRIIGGSSLRNRAPRVTINTDKEDLLEEDSKELPEIWQKTVPRRSRIPGPADYDPTHIRKPSPLHRRTRKLFVCEVPYSSEVKGPSVPSRLDENGYTVDENDVLIKNLPDQVDSTMGPAYYCVNHCTNMSKRLYGGCKWSARTAPRRTISALNDYPGPGSYDIEAKRDDAGSELAQRTREMAAAIAYRPRLLDAVQTQAIREGLPGPQDYNLQKAFIPRTSNKYSAFNVCAERFRLATDDCPGPGDYDCSSNSIYKKATQSEAGFGSKVSSTSKKASKRTPGPATYDIQRDPLQPKTLKYCVAPFETSAPRRTIHIEDLPGPADYVSPPIEKEMKETSIFKSKCGRFESITSRFSSASCATYNIVEDFNKLRNRKSFARKEVPFNSTSPRRSFKVKESPCTWIGKQEMSRKGFYFTRKPRFDNIDNGVPGPGAYAMQEFANSATLKANTTFNIRLKENVIGSKLCLAPNSTREAWQTEKRKRKILRVFHRPEIQFGESWLDLNLNAADH